MPDEAKSTTKPRCFFIAPIGSEGDDVRLHSDMVLNAIVKEALPEFDVQRADDFGRPEMITDKVIEAICTYELAVADLTGNNPNVLYELGLTNRPNQKPHDRSGIRRSAGSPRHG